MPELEKTQSLPFASVIVPALNCAEDVAGFAESMRNQDYPAECFEVIVVDNGSTDGTFDQARAAGMITLSRKERGRTRALNAGIAAAKGSIILTTDLSCRAEPHWIRTVVETFASHPEAGCVAGEIKLLRTADNAVISFQERNNYMSPLLALQRRHLPFMPFADGANASFRRTLFDEIGGFEESFVKAGDVEICYRMFVLTRYSLIFNPGALMWEPGEPSLRALIHQRFRMGIGWNLMLMKYPELFRPKTETLSPRRLWWKLNDRARKIGHLLSLNLGLLARRNSEMAMDANIRQLMSWAQWYGGLYGKRWLKKQGITPQRIDPAQLEAFMLQQAPLEGRVKLVGP